jgi:hypothetical protein
MSEAGAYLLGALTPADRADYAAHLAGCPYCQREVSELAGLPGLLARAPAPAQEESALESAAEDLAVGPEPVSPEPVSPDPVPPDPVPGALQAVRRHRMRARLLTAAAVVLVAAAAFGGALAVNRAPSATAPRALPVVLQAVGGTPATASAGLTDTSWGTVINMRCAFQQPPQDQSFVVVLVVRRADGTAEELARWTVEPGKEITVTSATDLRGAQLAKLEVQTVKGTTVLRTDRL